MASESDRTDPITRPSSARPMIMAQDAAAATRADVRASRLPRLSAIRSCCPYLTGTPRAFQSLLARGPGTERTGAFLSPLLHDLEHRDAGAHEHLGRPMERNVFHVRKHAQVADTPVAGVGGGVPGGAVLDYSLARLPRRERDDAPCGGGPRASGGMVGRHGEKELRDRDAGLDPHPARPIGDVALRVLCLALQPPVAGHAVLIICNKNAAVSVRFALRLVKPPHVAGSRQGR